MKLIKNILARIIALWATLIFIITMLIAYIPYGIAMTFPDPVKTRIFWRTSRIWMNVFLTLTAVWIVKKGKKNFKKNETYIVVCNHNSLMDVPVTTPFIPGPNKTIAKIEMSRTPLFGMIYKIGSVLVDRKSEESRKASFDKMKKVLGMGMHMCIYPEGTRNKTSEPLQRFHDGAFRLSVDSGHSILPLVLFNTGTILPHNKIFYYWPGKIKMHFLEPVAPGTLTVEQLKEKIFLQMKDHLMAQ